MSLRRWYSRSGLRRRVKSTQRALIYRLTVAVMGVLRRMPLDRALRVADRFGDLAYRFLPEGRMARHHVDLAFGDALTPRQREEIARASFRNAARCFVEVAKFDEICEHLDDYVDVEGWEAVSHILEAGKGGLVITGHIGNWELLAAAFARRGIPVAAIARRVYEPRLNELLVGFRARHGVRTILRESPSAGREMLKVLRSNGILAMLIDQDTKVQSVSVPFFGHMARTPVGAAALALRRDLPVVPVFAQRRPEGGHRLTILPPVEIERSGDRDKDVTRLTRRFNAILEERIRRNPTEWAWWHRRWRRKPQPRLDMDA